MKFLSILLCLLLTLNMKLPSLATDTVKAKNPTPARKLPLQGHIERKGKFKQSASINTNTKTGNPYSVSRPYNPDNPPPVNNKIHPVSSNAR